MPKNYEHQSDRKLLKEYRYFRPIGDAADAAESLDGMHEADLAELVAITDELADRVNDRE